MARTRSDKLVVHASGERWEWAVIDRNGQTIDRGHTPADDCQLPTGRGVTLLVDAAACTGLTVELPEMSARRLEQALRWAVEDQLASSAEDEHVVAGPRAADGRLHCLVVARERMRQWHAALAGQVIDVIVPDALCLPWQAGQVSLAAAGDRLLARWGEWSFGSFDPDLFEAMLEGLADPQARWIWYGAGCPQPLRERIGQFSHADRGLPEVLAAGAGQARVNLQGGDFAPATAAGVRRQWLWAAALAGLAVLLAVTTAGVELIQLKRQGDRLDAEILAQFSEAFPEVGRVVRPREQAERELARLRFGESAGVMELLHRTAPVLSAQSQVRLEGLNFRDAQLELTLVAPDLAGLDELEQRLRALDLRADVQSASLGSEGATGRIRVTEGGR